MIDGGLYGYNASAVATASCLVAVRKAGSGSAAADAVGTAVAGIVNIGEQSGVMRQAGHYNTCTLASRALHHSPCHRCLACTRPMLQRRLSSLGSRMALCTLR